MRVTTQDEEKQAVVIDNDDEWRERSSTVLQREGFHVEEFTNETQAITYLSAHHPHIVVIHFTEDMQRSLDCIELVAMNDPSISILYSTFYEGPKLHQRALNAGAFAVIPRADFSHQRSKLGALLDRAFHQSVTRRQHQVTKPTAFVLMPFAKRFSKRYALGIKEPLEAIGIKCERVDQIDFVGSISDEIFDSIRRASLIVADMTGRNPNVFYEVGLAHALEKPVILLTERTEEIPFDLHSYRHIVYGRSIVRMREELIKTVKEIFGRNLLATGLNAELEAQRFGRINILNKGQTASPGATVKKTPDRGFPTANSHPEAQRADQTDAEVLGKAQIVNIGTLAAGLSHDISHVMNDVNALLSSLITLIPEGFREKDPGKGIISSLIESTDYLRELFRTLVRYDGSKPLRYVPAQLSNILFNVQYIFSIRLQRKKIAVTIDGADIWLDCDPSQIEQVIANLFDNSIEAIAKRMTREGQITITARPMDDGFMELRFKDNGIGMSAEERQHAFDLFFTTKGKESPGFGLPICRKIVEDNHYGRIWIDLKTEEGTTIYFKLPRQQSKDQKLQ